MTHPARTWPTTADRPSPVADLQVPTKATAAQPRASEDDAFTRFYHTHAPRVYMLALRLCGNATDAAEVLSETFVRAWRGLPHFRGDSSPNTWLHTIAVRVWRESQRGQKRQMLTLDDDEYGLAAQGESPGHRIDLENAIASLPKGAREILILFAVEGYSHAEIADMLAISVGTVKAQVHRARKLLLERLDR